MTLTLNLSPEAAARLSRYAETTGKPAETVVAEMIETLPEATPPAPIKRTLGRHEGHIQWIADDFDDPPPDDYWDSPIFPEVVAPEAKP
ncbi:MAG: hypothetical protein H7Y38_18630 [Armatimonadetes bacterium]|nr:hypothetical protein [Armatimonadota bacterium]